MVKVNYLPFIITTIIIIAVVIIIITGSFIMTIIIVIAVILRLYVYVRPQYGPKGPQNGPEKRFGVSLGSLWTGAPRLESSDLGCLWGRFGEALHD